MIFIFDQCKQDFLVWLGFLFNVDSDLFLGWVLRLLDINFDFALRRFILRAGRWLAA